MISPLYKSWAHQIPPTDRERYYHKRVSNCTCRLLSAYPDPIPNLPEYFATESGYVSPTLRVICQCPEYLIILLVSKKNKILVLMLVRHSALRNNIFVHSWQSIAIIATSGQSSSHSFEEVAAHNCLYSVWMWWVSFPIVWSITMTAAVYQPSQHMPSFGGWRSLSRSTYLSDSATSSIGFKTFEEFQKYEVRSDVTVCSSQWWVLEVENQTSGYFTSV